MAKIPDLWPEPQLCVRSSASEAWRRSAGVWKDSRPVLALYPGAPDGERAWPMERFASIGAHFAGAGWTVWLVGGVREQVAAQFIRGKVPEARDLTDTSLPDAVCQLDHATVMLGVDAGLTHVAAALGTPTVMIHDWRTRFEHGPINRHVEQLEPPMASSRSGPDGVTEERVRQAIVTVAERAAATGRDRTVARRTM